MAPWSSSIPDTAKSDSLADLDRKISRNWLESPKHTARNGVTSRHLTVTACQEAFWCSETTLIQFASSGWQCSGSCRRSQPAQPPASGDLHRVPRPSETNELPPTAIRRPASGPVGVVSPGRRHRAAGCRPHTRCCSSGLLGWNGSLEAGSVGCFEKAHLPTIAGIDQNLLGIRAG